MSERGLQMNSAALAFRVITLFSTFKSRTFPGEIDPGPNHIFLGVKLEGIHT